jgi:hypothetical protein
MSGDSKRPPRATDNLTIETAGPRLAILSQDPSAGDAQ